MKVMYLLYVCTLFLMANIFYQKKKDFLLVKNCLTLDFFIAVEDLG